MIRTRLLRLSAFVVFLLANAVGDANALDYPKQTIKVVVPFAAAGVTDIVARVVFDRIARTAGQTIVIDNRPGAGGTIAVEQVVNAAPDGYTLIMADPSGSLPANVTLYPNLKYHPIRDLAPVAIFGTTGAVLLVNNDLPVKSAAGAGGARQEQARRTDLASTGVGTPGHLNGELFSRLAGIKSGARALSRGRAGRDRYRCRPHRVLDRADPDHAAERAAGTAPAARGRRRAALGRSARHSDRQGNRHRQLRRLHDLCGVRAAGDAKGYRRLAARSRLGARSTTRRCSRSCAPPASARRSARPKRSRKMLEWRIPEWADVIKSAGIKIN